MLRLVKELSRGNDEEPAWASLSYVTDSSFAVSSSDQAGLKNYIPDMHARACIHIHIHARARTHITHTRTHARALTHTQWRGIGAVLDDLQSTRISSGLGDRKAELCFAAVQDKLRPDSLEAAAAATSATCLHHWPAGSQVAKTLAVVEVETDRDHSECLHTCLMPRHLRRCLCVLPLSHQLDMRKVAIVLSGESGSCVRSTRLASRAELQHHFGYRPGTLGPFGLRGQPPPLVIIDTSVFALLRGQPKPPRILVGSGDARYHLVLDPHELTEHTGRQIRVADVRLFT